MNTDLSNKTVAILATNGFEEIELTNPREALDNAGVKTFLVAPSAETIRSWDSDKWGGEFEVDVKLENAKAEEFDSLLLPGGVINPDQLRMNEDALDFIRAFFDAGKPVAAICHGPQILIEAGVLEGRTITSYPSIKTDIENAGARWLDQEVVVDAGLTTSRSPEDLPAFNDKMLEELREGVHDDQTT
jgi:protease I